MVVDSTQRARVEQTATLRSPPHGIVWPNSTVGTSCRFAMCLPEATLSGSLRLPRQRACERWSCQIDPVLTSEYRRTLSCFRGCPRIPNYAASCEGLACG